MLTNASNLTPQAGRFFAKHTAQKSVQLAPLFMRALGFYQVVDMNFIFALIAILTFGAMGFDMPFFWLWNIFPIIVAAMIFYQMDKGQLYKSSSLHMILTILLLHSFFHAVMYFDIGEAATGSSTSALAYIFIPIYVFIFGVIVFLVSKLIRALFGKFKPNKAIK
jgi:hypothetical protein